MGKSAKTELESLVISELKPRRAVWDHMPKSVGGRKPEGEETLLMSEPLRNDPAKRSALTSIGYVSTLP